MSPGGPLDGGHLNPAGEEDAAGDGDLSHHGDPDDEVIVLEGPHEPEVGGPRVVKAPRVPTQKEIEAHEATHIPHEDWCEHCMAGRGRNKPHKRKDTEVPARADEAQEEVEVSEAGDALDGSPAEDASGSSPVPIGPTRRGAK